MTELNIRLTKKSADLIEKMIFTHEKIEIFPRNLSINTDGKGYWSRTAKSVDIKKIVFHKEEGTVDFREIYQMSAYFDEKSWSVEEHGLIYTDETFLAGIRDFLQPFNKKFRFVSYCEQGSQGDDYVHFWCYDD